MATVLEAGVDEGPNTTEEVSDVNETESAILGGASIFNIFFIDESLSCESPVEKHLYDILMPSIETSPPCYYCGESDSTRMATGSDDSYPLCHHCSTVKKYGPVLKRKKRTIIPRKQKPKNKRKKKGEVSQSSDDFLDSEEESEAEILDIDENCNEARNSFLDQYDVSSESEDDIPELPPSPHHQSLTDVSRKSEYTPELPLSPHHQSLADVSRESEDDIPKLPPSPHLQSLITVEDLLAGSDSDF